MGGLPVVGSLVVLYAVLLWALGRHRRRLAAEARWRDHIADLRAQTPGGGGCMTR